MKTLSAPISIAVSAQPPGLLSLGPNQAVELGLFNPIDPVGDTAGRSQSVTLYSGMQYDANRTRMVIFGGGHAASNCDAVHGFSLSSLQWVPDYAPTPIASLLPTNYDFSRGAWLSGPSGPYPRAAARHSLGLNVVVGDELIVMAYVEGDYPNLPGDWSQTQSYSQGSDHYTNTVAKIAHYGMVSNAWSFASVDGGSLRFPAAVLDPQSGKIFSLGMDGLDVYDPVARTRTRIFDLNAQYVIKDEQGNFISNDLLGYNQNLVYFPPNGNLYYVNSGNGTIFEVVLNRANLAASSITRIATGGPVIGETGVGYDSRNHIIGMGPANNLFYAFDPTIKTWSSKTIPQSCGTVSYHCLAFDDADGVFVFISSTNRTWAYRFA